MPKTYNWLISNKNKMSRYFIEMFAGIDREAVLPALDKKFLTDYYQSLETSVKPKKKNKVVIYTSCYVNYYNSKTGVAAHKILEKNDCEVIVSYPGCCGMPKFEQAQLKEVDKNARNIAKKLVKYVDDGYDIVTLTASCALMVKEEWGLIAKDDKNIKKVAKNIYDIDEYVVRLAKQNKGLKGKLKPVKGGVTLHHACHSRAQNIGNKAYEMLSLIPGTKIDIVEKCSGHGGTFGIMKKTHKLAKKFGKKAAKNIDNKNNKYVVSCCPLAEKHLKDLIIKASKKKEVKSYHPIEILAKAYEF
jgi:glycerol-3-phosphate dehydrogenase subunit C